MVRDVSNDLKWIRDNELKFIKKYLGKYLLVRKCRIEGVFDDNPTALKEGHRRFMKAKFIVYHIMKKEFIDDINRENRVLLEDN